ncbi:MAG: type II toxin-antitoxin system VapC family toxin [Longimicrobiales bacterium]
MIVVDTSALVESLGAGGRLRGELRRAIEAGERLALPTLVLYEWLRGPRVDAELRAQEALMPAARALPFGPEEASATAELYRELPRSRGRSVDLAIAACALTWDAALWTLNPDDFADVPGLRLWDAG